jgi:hypothetical protein
VPAYDVAPGLHEALRGFELPERLGFGDSPIAMLADRDHQEYVPRCIDVVAAQLRGALLGIQERRAPDPFGWIREVRV